jgi:short subunit fatty acids transporter
MNSRLFGRYLLIICIAVIIGLVAYELLNAPDKRSTVDKIGDAVEQLEDRTPADKLNDAAEDIGDKLRNTEEN